MNQSNIDNQGKGNDNTGIYDEYEVINIGDHEPLNDPNCKHKNVVEDPTEELGDAFTCKDCHIGWIVARS